MLSMWAGYSHYKNSGSQGRLRTSPTNVPSDEGEVIHPHPSSQVLLSGIHRVPIHCQSQPPKVVHGSELDELDELDPLLLLDSLLLELGLELDELDELGSELDELDSLDELGSELDELDSLLLLELDELLLALDELLLELDELLLELDELDSLDELESELIQQHSISAGSGIRFNLAVMLVVVVVALQ